MLVVYLGSEKWADACWRFIYNPILGSYNNGLISKPEFRRLLKKYSADTPLNNAQQSGGDRKIVPR